MRSDIIAAISTPPGKGGVAIIRISGVGCARLAGEIFVPVSGKPLSAYPPRTAVYGRIINNKGETVDDGLMTLFPEGSSYTGEETAEISCHGGLLVTREVLKTVLEAGALPAEAGEFTRRAFINGKLTLTEAEAIGNLLEARTEAQLSLASGRQRSLMKTELDSLCGELTALLSSVYARIDYPEEDLGEFTDTEILNSLDGILARLDRLIKSYRAGKAINEGITVSLIGRPNTGKSSLYNLILGEDKAIVTDVAGTTRDLLEANTSIGRVAVRLFDTAGIRNTSDAEAVEQIGIRLAEERLDESDLVIALFDITRPLSQEDIAIIERLGKRERPSICLLNKSDGEAVLTPDCMPGIFKDIFTVSVKEDPFTLLSLLTGAVESMFFEGEISPDTQPIVATLRQHASLSRARELVDSARRAIGELLPADCASSDIELALGALAELDGRAVSEAVVSDIFSRFCVGK